MHSVIQQGEILAGHARRERIPERAMAIKDLSTEHPLAAGSGPPAALQPPPAPGMGAWPKRNGAVSGTRGHGAGVKARDRGCAGREQRVRADCVSPARCLRFDRSAFLVEGIWLYNRFQERSG